MEVKERRTFVASELGSRFRISDARTSTRSRSSIGLAAKNGQVSPQLTPYAILLKTCGHKYEAA